MTSKLIGYVARSIGFKRPPEHVFEFFRRLHGVDTQPTAKQSYSKDVVEREER